MQANVDRARSYRKHKLYQEAIRCYDKAIARTPSTQLFDERAGCHARLGDLESALKDAKSSIQHSGNDPVGYLRAGKLLQMMDKKSVALEVMSRGLRKVKHTGQSYQALRDAHDQLTSELSPRNSIDPLTVLPRELAFIILDHLNFRQIVAIMRVSKGWNNYIRSCPDLWSHLDFSRARQRVRLSAVHSYVGVARSRIVKLTMNNLVNFEASLEVLLRQCPIEELCLGDAVPRLGTQFMEALARKKSLKAVHLTSQATPPPAALRQFVESRAATLQGLTYHIIGPVSSLLHTVELPEMLDLNIVASSPSGARNTSATAVSYAALPSMKKLRRLTMNCEYSDHHFEFRDDLHYLNRLEHLEIMAKGVGFDSLRLPHSLRFLSLSFEIDRDRALLTADVYKQDLPLLRVLRLETSQTLRCTGLLNAFLASEVKQMLLSVGDCLLTIEQDSSNSIPSNLDELRLAKCQIVGADHEESPLRRVLSHPRVSSVSTLVISEVRGWNDESMKTAGRCLPNLQHLEVHGCLQLTGVGVKDIIQRGGLRSLSITGCESVSADAIAWARTQKLRLTFRSSS